MQAFFPIFMFSKLCLKWNPATHAVKFLLSWTVEYLSTVPIWYLRLVPALSGSMIISLAYDLMQELHYSRWTALIAAFFIIIGKTDAFFFFGIFLS
jgi:dolichyl-phosphate-mannose--protein O-mannosyl transferase